MPKTIHIFTNDNVFFLLLKSYIVLNNSSLMCEKIKDHNDLEKIHRNDISMLLIDDKMVDISAIELIHLIRYTYRIASPVWLFSELKTAHHKQQVLLVGANKIIEKPFDPEFIAREIVKTAL